MQFVRLTKKTRFPKLSELFTIEMHVTHLKNTMHDISVGMA